MSKYAFGRTTTLGFERARERIVEELGKVGFGILTEIDVQATMKKKLDADMPPYRILGACNPNFAHQAIGAEPQIGALLPCNVVVRQDAQAVVHVELMDPHAVLGLVDNPKVAPLAAQVRERLEQALSALEA
ncbi:MAG: ABC transporter ATP-binding protein [Rubrivivax sp. SCN 71-131]|jgi:uncharacterized protein (DUF302 family)|nr:MAG: ABC transporter ATP-binding protein [Rubrivivax sp. SCN 71-131]